MKNKIVKSIAGAMLVTIALSGCGSQATIKEVSEDVTLTGESTAQTTSESASTAVSTNESAGTASSDDQIQKCLEGYATYLENHTELWQQETVYELDYINDDDIPDLIFGDTQASHGSNIYILTYLDGNYDSVTCCGAFGSYGTTCYYPKLGVMLSTDMGMGYETAYYSKLSSKEQGGYETLCHKYSYYEDEYEGEPTETKFFLGKDEDNEVTEKEFNDYINELVGDTEYKVFSTYNNDNGYEYLTQDAINELRSQH